MLELGIIMVSNTVITFMNFFCPFSYTSKMQYVICNVFNYNAIIAFFVKFFKILFVFFILHMYDPLYILNMFGHLYCWQILVGIQLCCKNELKVIGYQWNFWKQLYHKFFWFFELQFAMISTYMWCILGCFVM